MAKFAQHSCHDALKTKPRDYPADHESIALLKLRSFWLSKRVPDELWNDEVAQPVDGGWPVIVVDTEDVVGIAAVAAQVLHRAGAGPPALAPTPAR